MILSAKTEKGPVRESNQDSFECGMLENGIIWAVVCDGMGGASGGNVASSICVKKVSEAIKNNCLKNTKHKAIKNLLESAINAANAMIFDESLKDQSLKGMGTTIVAVVISGSMAVVAHVGDSRAYLVNNSITRLTKDHSLVQLMVDTGKITEDEAITHPERNIITRAVGIQNFVDVDIDVFDISDNDNILLCTDGLTTVVDEESIVNVIKTNKTSSAEKLVELSIERGSRDNITAVVIDGVQGE